MIDRSSEYTFILLILGPMTMLNGLRIWRKKRLIENTPCSKVRSAAMGRVELEGTARAKTILKAPQSQKPCCWWRVQVQEYRSNGKRSQWVTVSDIQSPEPFFIQDETGRVLIDPSGADVQTPTDTLQGPSSRVRYLEQRIEDGSPLYVLGDLGQRTDFLQGRRERLNRLIQQAKADPILLKNADANKDGQLDVQEWYALRVQLESRFLEQEKDRENAVPEDERLLIRQPRDEFYIVATGDEASLRHSLGRGAPLQTLGGIVFTAMGVGLAVREAYPAVAIFGIIIVSLLIERFISKGAFKWLPSLRLR